MNKKEFVKQAELIKQQLYKTAYLYLGNESNALDVVDETIYRGYKALWQLREEVDIYPTHMRIIWADEEENSAYLKKMRFYVENEEGERFDEVGNGITATGKEDSPMMNSYRVESSFFSKSKELTLYITEAE